MEILFISIKCKIQEWISPFKRKQEKKINYENWNPEIKIQMLWFLEWLLIESFIAYYFYRSYWAMIILLPGVWVYRKEKIKISRKKKKHDLEQQFKETLLSVQTNLQSGYSLENAFLESRSYISEIYGNFCDMKQELDRIAKGISNGDNLEHLLWDLGKRCPQSALEEFAAIYSIAYKMGNGWGEIIVKIIEDINRQIEVREEIELMIHGKKMECRIMCIIPFFILFYMNLTSKGYFDVLYHNLSGIVIMTVCLSVYVFAFLLSERITQV